MKTSLRLRVTAVLAMAFAFLGAAQATPVSVTFNFDLDALGFTGQPMSLLAPGYNTTISDGDDVTITYTFANNRGIRVTNANSGSQWWAIGHPWLQALGDVGTFHISNIGVTLLSPQFVVGGTSTFAISTDSSSEVHLGPYSGFMLDPFSSVTFTGVRASFHVDSLPGGTNTYTPWVYPTFGYTTATVVNVDANVPDAGHTASLLLVAFAALAFVRRRTA